jgi:protein SERAC1
MKGVPTVLVQSSSATHSRPWENEACHIQALNKTHSDLVKYSRHDGDYYRVLSLLQGFTRSAVAVIRDRFVMENGTTRSDICVQSCK